MNRDELSDLIRTIESETLPVGQSLAVNMYFDTFSSEEFLNCYELVVSFVLDLVSVTLQQSREALEEEAQKHTQQGKYLHYHGRDIHKRVIAEGFRPLVHRSAEPGKQISLLQYSSPIPGHAAQVLRVFKVMDWLADHLYTVSYTQRPSLSTDYHSLPMHFTIAAMPPQRILAQLNKLGWELYPQERRNSLEFDREAIQNGPTDIIEEDKQYLVFPSTDQPRQPAIVLRNPRRFIMTTKASGIQYLHSILFKHGRVYLGVGQETVVVPLHTLEQSLQEGTIQGNYQPLH